MIRKENDTQDQKQRFSLRKLTVGLASVLVGVSFMSFSQTVHADTNDQSTVDKNNVTVQSSKLSVITNSETNPVSTNETQTLTVSKLTKSNMKLLSESKAF